MIAALSGRFIFIDSFLELFMLLLESTTGTVLFVSVLASADSPRSMTVVALTGSPDQTNKIAYMGPLVTEVETS